MKKNIKRSTMALILVLQLVIAAMFGSAVAIAAGSGGDPDYIDATMVTGGTAQIYQDQIVNYNLAGNEIDIIVDEPKEIALVIDTSGSMKDDVNGNYASNTSLRRISIAKQAANNFVDRFKDTNTKICVVPYSTDADSVGSLMDLNTPSEVQALHNKIDSLSAVGGTNIGDGLRRAYYKLKNSGSSVSKKYIVLMTDGVPTYYTNATSERHWSSYEPNYKMNDGNASYIYGPGSSDTGDQRCLGYAEAIGENLIATESNMKTFVVGFTSGAGKCEQIAQACGSAKIPEEGNRRYYRALTADAIINVYDKIATQILDDTISIGTVRYEQTFPAEVKVVEVPVGFTATLLGDGRYKVEGAIDGCVLKRQENGKYKFETREFNVKVQYKKAGEVSYPSGVISYNDYFGNPQTATISGIAVDVENIKDVN